MAILRVKHFIKEYVSNDVIVSIDIGGNDGRVYSMMVV